MSSSPTNTAACTDSTRRMSSWELFIDGSWTSYLAAGTAAIMLSWFLTGCRLGNRTNNGTPPPADTLTGVYSNTPSAMETCILKAGQTDPVCASPAPSVAPAELLSLMSDPVAVGIVDTSTGDTRIFSPFATPDSQGKVPAISITTTLSDGTMSGGGTYPVVTYWTDTACQETDKTQLKGALNTTGAGTIVQNYTIKGRIQFSYASYTYLDGNCAASTAAVVACLQDVTKCLQADAATNQAQQNFWKSYYKPYIDSGLMTISDIPNVVTLAYGVLFQ